MEGAVFGRFVSIAEFMIVFSLFQPVDQKKFALSNPNIYKTASGAAGAGSAVGECPNALI